MPEEEARAAAETEAQRKKEEEKAEAFEGLNELSWDLVMGYHVEIILSYFSRLRKCQRFLGSLRTRVY